MVDTIEIKEAETTSEKPVEEKSTQSIEGLPEKFKSVEDLAKSYSELEKKLGEQNPKQEEVDPVNKAELKEEEPKNDLEIAEKIGNQVQTGTFYMNRCDYLDPALSWTGVKETGKGCSLSEIAYEKLTSPKSFHLRKEQ